MKKINCILIHVPRFFKEKDKLFSDINFAAIGLFSLAGEIEKEGHYVKIIHLGIEKYLQKDFDICKYINDNKIDFAALSLNWHHQSYNVIETAKQIKENCPQTFITLGGNTATYYAQEIMDKFSFIDAIIKGEGEKPVRELVNCLSSNISPANVQNLYWRNKNKIIKNELSFFALDNDLNNFEYFNPDRMLHYEEYSKIPYIIDYSKENQLSSPTTEQVICLGRGCLGNCAWCAGGYNISKRMTGRNCISYRDIRNITNEIQILKEEYNIKTFRFSFDPNPADRGFLISLFDSIAEKFHGKLHAIYNLDGLPDKTFLEAYKRAFCEESTLLLSPVSQNENIRKKYKSFFYTNKQLEASLAYMEKLKINSEIYFSPLFATEQENKENEEYAQFLKNKYKYLKNVLIYDMGITPGAPISECPEKYNLDIKPMSFTDYYKQYSYLPHI